MNKDIAVFKKAREMELARLRRIAEGAADEGAEASPLCRLFMHDNCEQCPIYISSGYSDCRLTPYAEWARHQSERHFRAEPPYIVECDHCRELLARVYSYTKHAPLFMEKQINLI